MFRISRPFVLACLSCTWITAAHADPAIIGTPDELNAVTASYESSVAAVAQARAHDAILLSRATAQVEALKKELATEQAKSVSLAKALADATRTDKSKDTPK